MKALALIIVLVIVVSGVTIAGLDLIGKFDCPECPECVQATCPPEDVYFWAQHANGHTALMHLEKGFLDNPEWVKTKEQIEKEMENLKEE